MIRYPQTFGLLAVIAAFLCLPNRTDAGIFVNSADNYQECILERLEGTENDVAAVQATLQCREDFPSLTMPEQENSLLSGLFGPDNFSECMAKYVKKTPSLFAARQLRDACYLLYPND